MKPGRNDPCSCGSGKKYKNCCMRKAEAATPFGHHAATTQPGYEELNLLSSLFSSGHYEQQEKLARSLLKSHPDSGVVWKLYGLSLQMQGKDAITALKKAAELLPNDAEAHGNYAALLRLRGQLDAALSSARRALQIKPDFAGGLVNIGVILQDLGQLEEAAASYRRALELKPDMAEAHNNLGGVLKELGDLAGAEASYRRALELKPDFARVHSNLGVVMRELGQPESELECYRLALQHDPLCHEAMLGLGQLCMAGGEMAEAEMLFRKAIEISPDNIEARLLLAQVKKVQPGDENIAALETIDAEARRSVTPLPYRKAIFLHFALGKGYDDLRKYDLAFPHFLEGARLKRQTFGYDVQETSSRFEDVMRIFDHEMITRLRNAGDPSDVPIFVLGMPRSGSTLTEQILASHPEVHGAGELPDLMAIAQRIVDGKPYPANVTLLDHAVLTAWGNDYVAGLRQRAPDAKRITDKSPGNFLALGLIHVMLPNAKVIHVSRNPVDTCLSCFMQLFSNGQEYTYNLAELGHYYADYVRLMAHWRKVLPAGSFLDVRYEDIISDPEGQARRIIDYCGLEWNDACLDFHNSERAVRTASVTQVRQPIYKTSVERWRNYEKFLNPLLEALGDAAPH